MMDDGRKFGECPLCHEKDRWLYFALGRHKCDIWCKWICKECYEKIKGK